MKHIFTKTTFLLIIVVLFVLNCLVGFAQNVEFIPEQTCPKFVEDIDKACEELSVENCRKILEDCEKFYQQKSGEYKKEIEAVKSKQKTLNGQIQLLDKRVKGLDSQIKISNLKVKDLNLQVQDTQNSIATTSAKIDEVKNNLTNILRLQYEEDQRSLPEILLSGNNLSDFFDDLMALEVLNSNTQNLLEKIQGLKNDLQNQQDRMIEEKGSLEKNVLLNSLQREENKKFQSQKQELLNNTKGEEALYKKYLEESEKKAKEIRKKIFELAQVTGSQAVTLEQAYSLAREVEKSTGVRAVLILGLLQTESAIGKNVGQCNCEGISYCKYPDLSFQDVNTNKGQWEAFKTITESLGMDSNKAPVSCYVGGGKVQSGGAMGPAQFMPQTWLGLGYKERVEKITGVKPANPWRIRDAFFAAGLYLSDNGASSQKEIDEIGAITAYLCGTKTMTARCRQSGGPGYVKNTMQNTNLFQGYVDQGILQN